MTISFINRKLCANGLKFNLREIGVKEPTLVFIHYLGGTGRTWDLVAEQLSERHRCLAPDLRGWGGSDKDATSFDLHTQADDIAAIIQSLGLSQYILVGQSMGGKIAQILAARTPAGLKGLVLVAPAPPTPTEVSKEQREAALNSYLSPAGVEVALTILTSRQLSPELRKQVTDDTLGGTLAATCLVRARYGARHPRFGWQHQHSYHGRCRRRRQGGERTCLATRARESH
jgi:pimeloyl-ACP methyl ester carboxylesterase